jgi:hypothetical protein
VESLLPLVRMKHEKEFMWGDDQRKALEHIKKYLTQPPMLRAPKTGKPFRLYVVATEQIIGSMLAQEETGKEFIVAYLSRRMVDAETRYTPVEKLCLSLYYACSKFRHYLLSGTCIVACRCDVVSHMMQKPILSGRMGKWAYSLVEFDLVYEPLKVIRGQVVADFIVDHGVETDNTCLVSMCPWTLSFDGSVCSHGCGIGCVIKSIGGMMHKVVVLLEFRCTNNQVQYEALLVGLRMMIDMGVKDVEAFGDS